MHLIYVDMNVMGSFLNRSNMDEREMCQYELCSIPSSMFDASGLMKSPDKPELAKSISKLCKLDPSQTTVPSTAVGFVLDGGSLLHKITWLVIS